ncbi:hypothetical protein D3C87_1492280 [compost metagenome]
MRHQYGDERVRHAQAQQQRVSLDRDPEDARQVKQPQNFASPLVRPQHWQACRDEIRQGGDIDVTASLVPNKDRLDESVDQRRVLSV